jgi:uncharacterized oligopeptide transporter (OPT) family protein
MMIIDSKLPYPSGTATGVLINGFHTPKGNVMAKYGYETNYVYVICTLFVISR